MRAIVLSTLCALLIASGIVALISLAHSPGRSQSTGRIRRELTELAESVRRTEDSLKKLENRLARLEREAAQPATEAPQAGAPAESSARGENDKEAVSPPEILRPYSADMRDYVFALIDEERALQEQLRRERAEQLRRELEEMRKGPYERFKLKVNSLGRALGLDTAQKDRYHELSKAYWDELQELRKTTKWQYISGLSPDFFTQSKKYSTIPYTSNVPVVFRNERGKRVGHPTRHWSCQGKPEEENQNRIEGVCP
jgi:hypothetical protein